MENLIFGAFCVFWVKIVISDGKLDFRCILRVLTENIDFDLRCIPRPQKTVLVLSSRVEILTSHESRYWKSITG